MSKKGVRVVNSRAGRNNRNADRVQNKGVRRVPKESADVLSDAGGIWVLDPQPFIVHNRHIRSGEKYGAGCTVCEPAMDTVTGVVEAPRVGRGVGESGGVDEEESATLPPRSVLERLLEPESGL